MKNKVERTEAKMEADRNFEEAMRCSRKGYGQRALEFYVKARKGYESIEDAEMIKITKDKIEEKREQKKDADKNLRLARKYSKKHDNYKAIDCYDNAIKYYGQFGDEAKWIEILEEKIHAYPDAALPSKREMRIFNTCF